MSAINELKETLEHTITAQFVTTMLRDISATKLQSIRALFDANLAYFHELHELMSLVQSYGAEVQADIDTTNKTTKQKTNTVATAASKKVYVALTSNKRFYGTLNHEIMHALTDALSKDVHAQCVVIGQTGRQIADVVPLPRKANFLAFAKDEPTQSELLACVQQLAPYTEIIVIHPTFISSFQQHAYTTDITHVPKRQESQKPRTIDYVFEPEIPKIIAFFSTQIRLVLFGRALLETRLALTGARLMKMQRAREKAGELVLQQRRTIHKEMTTVQSMRLLEAFAGFRIKNTL